MVKQVSVFLKNQPGELMTVTGLLADNNVNIKSLMVADTADFGILRLILDDPDKAIEILKENNLLVDSTDIIAVEMKDRPGGLHEIASVLGNEHVNIEYLYAFSHKSGGDAVLLLAIGKDAHDQAIEVLESNNFKIFAQEDVPDL
ncbi:MAG TPA: ACT domain-containing protein [Candidatus Lokiarchaeia archaeon]|nr:ACT domain-containing protein [Candidatus Lokiarchaeia archaeon]